MEIRGYTVLEKRASRHGNGAIPVGDRDLLRTFVHEVWAMSSISPKRRYKIVSTLIGWRRLIAQGVWRLVPDDEA